MAEQLLLIEPGGYQPPKRRENAVKTPATGQPPACGRIANFAREVCAQKSPHQQEKAQKNGVSGGLDFFAALPRRANFARRLVVGVLFGVGLFFAEGEYFDEEIYPRSADASSASEQLSAANKTTAGGRADG